MILRGFGTISGKTIAVIGGGPAGMMAALSAAQNNNKVILFDKMEEIGKKLCITGKGRCNLTHHVESPKELIDFYPGGGRFLHSAFSRFSSADLISFFKNKGLNCKVERGKRVFPISDNARDVLDVLLAELRKSGVEIRLKTPIIEVLTENSKISGVKTILGENLKSDKIVISTGGMTYPWTGSTGDGYQIAKKLGHTIVTPRPSLVPLEVEENKITRALEGLSLKNVKAILKQNNKVIDSRFGDMIFTSFGLSGPIMLYLSRTAVLLLAEKKGQISISIDLKPALSKDKLKLRLESDFQQFRKKIFKNSLEELLPQKMIPVFVELSRIHAGKQCAQINNAEKERFLELLKNFTFKLTKARNMSEAEVTQGGVELKEVDPRTMESRIISGLYFAGEVLDIDGYIGGYNLQAAFSTGFLAGICCSS